MIKAVFGNPWERSSIRSFIADAYRWHGVTAVLLGVAGRHNHLQELRWTRKEARATWRSLVKHDSPQLGLSQSWGLINIYSFRLGERATRTLIIAELSGLWVAGAWQVVSRRTVIGEYISFHLWWWLERCLWLHLNVTAQLAAFEPDAEVIKKRR